MKNTAKKIISLVLCLMCAFSPVLQSLSYIPGLYVSAAAAENTYLISSTEDFLEFADLCTLDTYSSGKTFVLKADIDLSKTSFSGVPAFSGVFDGAGHTVKGLKITSGGEYKALFRYVLKSGVIKNLNVSGDISPKGTDNYIAGIAASNEGTISDCTFTGTLSGSLYIGGIAGINKQGAYIRNCTSYAGISGKRYTGGIAGKNSGTISGCINNGDVNSYEKSTSTSLDGLDTDFSAALEKFRISREQNEESIVAGHSDAGGIAGFSDGTINNCRNNAVVGYQHIGYNIGGIAGRQSGYIENCSNYGRIYGRKDVGGIVGQAEPFIVLSISESALDKLKRELDGLNSEMNTLTDHASETSDDISQSVDSINGLTDEARKNAENLADGVTDFADENIDVVNDIFNTLSDTLDKLEPVTDEIRDGFDGLSESMDLLKKAVDNIDINLPDSDAAYDKLCDGVDEMQVSVDALSSAFDKLSLAMSDLEDAFVIKNKSKVKSAFKDMADSFALLVQANTKLGNSLDKIQGVMDELPPENIDEVLLIYKSLSKYLKNIAGSVSDMSDALNGIMNAMLTVSQNVEFDIDSFESFTDRLQSASKSLSFAMKKMNSAVDTLSDAIDEERTLYKDFANETADQINAACDDLSAAFDKLSETSDILSDAVDKTGDIISDLSEKDFKFVKISEETRTSSDNIFDAMESIGKEIDSINGKLSGKADTIDADLRKIYDLFSSINNVLKDAVDELRNNNLDDYLEDASEENIEATREGKVKSSRNYGKIDADRNVGGIAGSMAVEYTSDPEDDIEKPDTLNFTYRTKSILQECENFGRITGKKDCIGGIVGWMNLGTVYVCYGFGDVESTAGKYAGGVAGFSSSSVRKSYAKCAVSAEKYAGGIAGRAETLTGCVSVCRVSSDEAAGAVAGGFGDFEKIKDNIYVDSGVGAIDGVSYTGRATAVGFDAVSSIEGAPEALSKLKITFTDGDEDEPETLYVLYADYGSSLEAERIPEVPERDGFYGSWENISDCNNIRADVTVNALYLPYIETIESGILDGYTLPMIIAEGKFTDKAYINVKFGNTSPAASLHAKQTAVVLDAELFGTDLGENDITQVRILNPDKKKAAVWKLDNGKWKRLKSENRGSYIITEMSGKTETFCIIYGWRDAKSVTLIYVLCGGILGIIAAVTAIVLKKKRRAKKQKTAK